MRPRFAWPPAEQPTTLCTGGQTEDGRGSLFSSLRPRIGGGPRAILGTRPELGTSRRNARSGRTTPASPKPRGNGKPAGNAPAHLVWLGANCNARLRCVIPRIYFGPGGRWLSLPIGRRAVSKEGMRYSRAVATQPMKNTWPFVRAASPDLVGKYRAVLGAVVGVPLLAAEPATRQFQPPPISVRAGFTVEVAAAPPLVGHPTDARAGRGQRHAERVRRPGRDRTDCAAHSQPNPARPSGFTARTPPRRRPTACRPSRCCGTSCTLCRARHGESRGNGGGARHGWRCRSGGGDGFPTSASGRWKRTRHDQDGPAPTLPFRVSTTRDG